MLPEEVLKKLQEKTGLSKEEAEILEAAKKESLKQKKVTHKNFGS
jgi:hypothetical protein